MMLNLLLFTLISCAVNASSTTKHMESSTTKHMEEVKVEQKLANAGLATENDHDWWITINSTPASKANGINFAKQATTDNYREFMTKLAEIVMNKKVYLIKGYSDMKDADLQEPLAAFNHAKDAAKRIYTSGAEIIGWDGDDAHPENFLGRILRELPAKTLSGRPWKFVFMNLPNGLNDPKRQHRKNLNAFFSKDFIADMLDSDGLNLFPKDSEIYGLFMDDTEIMKPYVSYEAKEKFTNAVEQVAHYAKNIKNDHYLYRSSALGEMLFNILKSFNVEIEVLALGGGPVVGCEYVRYLRALGDKFHAYPTTRDEGDRHPMLFNSATMQQLGAEALNPDISPAKNTLGWILYENCGQGCDCGILHLIDGLRTRHSLQN